MLYSASPSGWSRRVLAIHRACLALALSVEEEGDDKSGTGISKKADGERHGARGALAYIPIETQNFAKDENQDHADKNPRLVHVRPDALVADDTNAVPGSQPRQSDRQPARKVHNSTVSLVSMRRLDGWRNAARERRT